MNLCRKVFSIVDKDGSGYLSRREAKRACKLIGEKFGIMEVGLETLTMFSSSCPRSRAGSPTWMLTGTVNWVMRSSRSASPGIFSSISEVQAGTPETFGYISLMWNSNKETIKYQFLQQNVFVTDNTSVWKIIELRGTSLAILHLWWFMIWTFLFGSLWFLTLFSWKRNTVRGDGRP